jgi:hypothetical protein
MTKFIVATFYDYPNKAHYGLYLRITTELAKTGASVKNALGTLLTDLDGLFVTETACMEWVGKSVLTEEVAETNHELDHVLTGLTAQVNGARYNVNATVAAAALRIYVMIRNYGNVIKQPYLEQAASVEGILLHLTTDYAADVTTAGVGQWTPVLRAALDAFYIPLRQREAQSLKKPPENFRKVRHDIDLVWHQIATRINAGAELNTSPDFAAIINLLNPEIELLNRKFHHARHNIANAQPEPFEAQYYTGQPLTPLPGSVLFTTPEETVKLELGRDYNVSYRNNVEVGIADCTFHGKGHYKGHKTVTFAIVRK